MQHIKVRARYGASTYIRARYGTSASYLQTIGWGRLVGHCYYICHRTMQVIPQILLDIVLPLRSSAYCSVFSSICAPIMYTPKQSFSLTTQICDIGLPFLTPASWVASDRSTREPALQATRVSTDERVCDELMISFVHCLLFRS